MLGPRRKATSRRTRRVEQAAVGTHVKRTSRSSTKNNSVNLKARAASRTGEISHVVPQTSSRESRSAYAHRARQKGFTWRSQTKEKVRTIILAVLVIAALVAVALGVTWLVFKAQIDSKMHLKDAALSEVLSAPEEEGDPYYVLIAGAFNDSMREDDGPHLLTLARIDETNHVITLVNLPNNIEMTMSDDEYHILSYAKLLGGNAELVTQVENLCGVELSHVVLLDDMGFVDIVDKMGGVTVDLAQEADDPDTGSIYIPAGVQHLDGQQALTLVRCDNYTTPLDTRAEVQAHVIEALLQQLLAKSRFGKMTSLDAVAKNIQTTMSFDDLWQLVKSLGSGNDITFYSGIVPGQISVDPDGTFYSVSRAPFDNMMEAVKEGRNPDEAATISGLTPDIVRVSVKNGAGIVGGAADVAAVLEAAGYQVPTTGNADNYVYDETLVIYKSDLYKPTAEDILSILGNGRTVEAGLFYEFDEDILVIVGKDWIPIN